MSGINIEKARQFLRDKEKRRQEMLRMRLAQARGDFEAIVRTIIGKYDVKRISQWGSLLDEAHFSALSDIDIALEGVASAGEYFQIYGEAMKLTDFPLDIIEIERIEPEFREMIVQQGRLVHERK